MPLNYKQFHELEDELIQIIGLMKALQILLPDGSTHTCVANALAARLDNFQKLFYQPSLTDV